MAYIGSVLKNDYRKLFWRHLIVRQLFWIQNRKGFTPESSVSKTPKKENIFVLLSCSVNITWRCLSSFASCLLNIHHLSSFISICSRPLNNRHPTLFSFVCISSAWQSLSDITHLHLLGNISLIFLFKDSSVLCISHFFNMPISLSISTKSNHFYGSHTVWKLFFNSSRSYWKDCPFTLLHHDEYSVFPIFTSWGKKYLYYFIYSYKHVYMCTQIYKYI